MATIYDMSLMAQAVYTGGSVGRWVASRFRPAWRGFLSEGLQAELYTHGPMKRVVAFRGTNVSWRVVALGQDLVADAALGVGMNSNYFSAAERYVQSLGGVVDDVVLCGHSLGGAVAQVVGNRMGLRFATFNAPGVAVWASRNMATSTDFGLQVRTAGMMVSALAHPVQAFQDVKAALRPVRGLNICIDNDPVSKIGVHYGEVRTIVGASRTGSAIERHAIANVIASLSVNAHPTDVGLIDSNKFK